MNLDGLLATLFYRFGYRRHNEVTLQAIHDIKNGIDAGEVDISSYDAFLKSVLYEKEH